MCLISKWRFPRKAKEDIVCFKVLRYCKISNGWITPYRYAVIYLGKEFVAKNQKTFSISNPYKKDKGYIHAFTAKEYVRYNMWNNESVFKVIIPKGTRYHISKQGIEICARKMYITEEKVLYVNL